MEWQQRTGQKCTPVLCDVDMYFIIHKLHNNVTYTTVWLVACVQVLFDHVLPPVSNLLDRAGTFPDHPTSKTIRTNLNIDMVEQMVLSAFPTSGGVTPHICGDLATLARLGKLYRAGSVKREHLQALHHLQALLHLFRDYVPALFYLGSLCVVCIGGGTRWTWVPASPHKKLHQV